MKTSGNLSLKNSYQYLQKRMWQISQKASSLNKQNDMLKGRFSTQRVMIKKRKVQTTYAKNTEQQQLKKQILSKNFDQSCKTNSRMKQKISNLEQQRKQIIEKLNYKQKLEKKHRRLEIELKKYSKKMKRAQGQHRTSFPQNRLLKQHEFVNQTISVVQKEQQGLIQEIEKIIVELDEEKKYNKFLSSEILNLIDQKNKIKKSLKKERQADDSKKKRK